MLISFYTFCGFARLYFILIMLIKNEKGRTSHSKARLGLEYPPIVATNIGALLPFKIN